MISWIKNHKKSVYFSIVVILLVGGSFEALELISLKDLSFDIYDLEFTKTDEQEVEITIELEVHNSHWKEVSVKRIEGILEINENYIGDIQSSSFSVQGKDTKIIPLILTVSPLHTNLSPVLSLLLEAFLTGNQMNILFYGKVHYRFLQFSFENSLTKALYSTGSSIDILSIKAPSESNKVEFGIAITDFPLPINVTSCNFEFISEGKMGDLTLTEPLILLDEEQSLLNLTFETSDLCSRENFLTHLLSNYPEQNITLSGEFSWSYYSVSGVAELPIVDFLIDRLIDEATVIFSDSEILSISQQEDIDKLELEMNMTLFNTYLMNINVSNIVFNAYSDTNVTKNIAHASLLENYYLEGNTTTSLMLNLTIILTE
ncbi:MAG: hypothetical protein ACTSYA_02400, partial [Candidatus Kariarchaeaceae archaeon]